jgi:hypothetical protein
MIDCIENIERLTAVLGMSSFYDFHDGEIVSVAFDRQSPVTITLVLQLPRRLNDFENEGKMWEKWLYSDVTFVFHGVQNCELDSFNHQNVIDELRIVRDEERYLVHFKQSFGCDLKFLCERMILTEVVSNAVERLKAA